VRVLAPLTNARNAAKHRRLLSRIDVASRTA
jgi:hypothetical protein